MAGDWIKIECGLPEKAEVWEIAMTLGIDPDTVVGKLIKVWRWFDQQTEDGNARSVTYNLLDHVAGNAGFAEAMSFVGWLSIKGKDASLPNFERHNGKTAKNRALTAKRVAEHKAKNGNAKVTQTPLPREENKRVIDQEQELPPSSPKAKKAATKGTRLPDDWMPDAELIAQVTTESGDLWKRELPKFKDYWPAQPGQRGVKLDWRGTFRNWVRKAAESQPRYGPRQQQPSRQAAIAEALLRDSRYADTAARQPGLALPHRDRRPADAHAAVAAISAGPGHDPGDGDGLD